MPPPDHVETGRCECDTCIRIEYTRLRTLLDNRPAINAGLPDTYIEWTSEVYASDMRAAIGMKAN